MKRKGLIITATLLTISIGNYFRIIDSGSVRTVEFISIFAIGALTGILLVLIFRDLLHRF